MRHVDSVSVQEYMDWLKVEFPQLTISDKKSWWLKVIFNLPGIKKLGWNDATQTIGMNIWLSDKWDEISPVYQLATLRHERKHLIWFRNHTTILASILYLFFVFPIGLAYYRACFERDGSAESMRTRVQYFGSTERIKEACREIYLRTFTGWTYFKMWPFEKTVLKWFEEDWAKAVRMYG